MVAAMTDLFGEISRQDKLGCARREVRMRESAYPRWVAADKMSKDDADRELAIMRAIVMDYESGRLENNHQ